MAETLTRQFARSKSDRIFFYNLAQKFLNATTENPAAALEELKDVLSLIDNDRGRGGALIFSTKVLIDLSNLNSENSTAIQNAFIYAISFAKANELRALQSAVHNPTGEKVFLPHKSRSEYITFVESEHPDLAIAVKRVIPKISFIKYKTVAARIGYLIEQSDSGMKFRP